MLKVEAQKLFKNEQLRSTYQDSNLSKLYQMKLVLHFIKRLKNSGVNLSNNNSACLTYRINWSLRNSVLLVLARVKWEVCLRGQRASVGGVLLWVAS